MSQDPQSRPSQGQKEQTRTKKSAAKKEKEQQFTLKTVDRMLKWPVVDIAWNEGNHVYGKIKGESVFGSFLSSSLTFVSISIRF